MRRIVLGILVVAMAVFAVACSNAPKKAAKAAASSSTATTAKYTFYAIGGSPGQDPFFASVYKGMQAAAKAHGIDLHYLAPSQPTAVQMVNSLQTAVAAKPDGIIAGFWFAKAEHDIVDQAMKSGIPVLAFNQADNRPEAVRDKYLGYVGMDDRITGALLAKATLAKTPIKRAVVGLMYPGSAPIENRANGIIDVLKQHGIPCPKLDLTTTSATAQNVLGAYLTKYPDTNVVFVLGPVNTDPTLQLLKQRGLLKKVLVSTFDVDKQTIAGIESGDIVYTISQQPFAQGYLSVTELYLYKEYGIIPPSDTPTGPTLVDKSNIAAIKKQVASTGGA